MQEAEVGSEVEVAPHQVLRVDAVVLVAMPPLFSECLASR